MSLVMHLPPQPPSPAHKSFASRSSTPIPGRLGSATPPASVRLHSRPATPPPGAAGQQAHNNNLAHLPSHLAQALHTISAPPTPVTTTHIAALPNVASVGMERCRSSEAVLSHTHSHLQVAPHVHENGSASADATPRRPHPLAALPPTQDLQAPIDLPGSNDVSPLSSPLGADFGDDGRMDMDIDEVEVPMPELGLPTSDDSGVWGMPKWGLEDERPEVRPGVRLVGMEELPVLLERHSLLDTPSQVMFPWLHGIADDGAKGREMGAFFGYGPPFEPPPYRGLSLVLAPPHPQDKAAPTASPAMPINSLKASQEPGLAPVEDEDGKAESYNSSNAGISSSPTTTAESLGPVTPPATERKLSDAAAIVSDLDLNDRGEPSTSEVAMHPCQSKSPTAPQVQLDDSSDSDSSSYISEDDPGPSCILMNAIHCQDVFELPMFPSQPGRRPSYTRTPANEKDRIRGRFRPARLPNQINLRNLHIQQIKYCTVSDIILYTRHGVTPGALDIAESIAEAQADLYKQRMEEFYAHVQGRESGEGLDRPVKYGVWVLVEPFTKVEKFCPDLVNIDSNGNTTENSKLVDLFEREAFESRAMTHATEVLDGFWVGNDTDVPGGADDGAGATVPFDICVRASECSDMPTTALLALAYRSLLALDRVKAAEQGHWSSSPATVALRNLLSPANSSSAQSPPPQQQLATSPDETHMYAQQHAAEHRYVTLDCAGSCRTLSGQLRNLATMTDKVIELVNFMRKLIDGRDKAGIKRKILVHCQDGYTESSILVLSFIMASLGCTLPEAYLHLQQNAKRSFFLYPTDRPLLHRIEARLMQERRERAAKRPNGSSSEETSPTTSPSRWKNWTGLLRYPSSPTSPERTDGRKREHEEGPGQRERSPERPQERETRDRGRGTPSRRTNDAPAAPSQPAPESRVWFDDKRFDGFPSRILPFLYLGNLEHAGNAAMLKSLNITHVVSVGESLLDGHPDCDPLHGWVGGNTLANAARAGHIQV